jgi:hypothetical protein
MVRSTFKSQYIFFFNIKFLFLDFLTSSIRAYASKTQVRFEVQSTIYYELDFELS